MRQFFIKYPVVGAVANLVLPGVTYLILQTRIYFGIALITGIILVGFAGSQTTDSSTVDGNTLSILGGMLIWFAFAVDGFLECKSLQKEKKK